RRHTSFSRDWSSDVCSSDLNSNVLMAPAMDAEVRYALIDTNNDNERDALNPAERLGDTASRGLEIFMKKPSAATGSNLTGDFGQIGRASCRVRVKITNLIIF